MINYNGPKKGLGRLEDKECVWMILLLVVMWSLFQKEAVIFVFLNLNFDKLARKLKFIKDVLISLSLNYFKWSENLLHQNIQFGPRRIKMKISLGCYRTVRIRVELSLVSEFSIIKRFFNLALEAF